MPGPVGTSRQRRNIEILLGSSALQRLEVGDEVVRLVRLQPELGHGWVPGGDALGQCLAEVLDGIAVVEFAEWGAPRAADWIRLARRRGTGRNWTGRWSRPA